MCITFVLFFFFFNDTATTEIYTLSLHDALPILRHVARLHDDLLLLEIEHALAGENHHSEVVEAVVDLGGRRIIRSEEHTSELQSLTNLVCRLLLEKKT